MRVSLCLPWSFTLTFDFPFKIYSCAIAGGDPIFHAKMIMSNQTLHSFMIFSPERNCWLTMINIHQRNLLMHHPPKRLQLRSNPNLCRTMPPHLLWLECRSRHCSLCRNMRLQPPLLLRLLPPPTHLPQPLLQKWPRQPSSNIRSNSRRRSKRRRPRRVDAPTITAVYRTRDNLIHLPGGYLMTRLPHTAWLHTLK